MTLNEPNQSFKVTVIFEDEYLKTVQITHMLNLHCNVPLLHGFPQQ